MKTITQDKLKIINDTLKLLEKLDKFVTYDGLRTLVEAETQLVLLRTIITVEDEMNEN